MEWSFPADRSPRDVAAAAAPPHRLRVCPPPPETFESGRAERACTLFVPRSYTPTYAYPLIVWFHDEGTDERDVLEWLPRLSPQNYVGLGLRGPLPIVRGLPNQRTWSTGPQHLAWLEDHLSVALAKTVRQRSIHTGRIVAAGIGRGATVALQLLLRRPDLFAAAAGLNAELPPDVHLDRCDLPSGRRLWLGHSRLLACGNYPAVESIDRLQTAGLDVTRRSFTDDEWPPEVAGRDIDTWLMTTFCSDTAVF